MSTGKEKERETLVSYSDIQTLPDLSCYVTLPGPYPAVKLALKYKPRPKIAEGFIQRSLDTRVDTRLSALLEAREAEGSLARALFTPDAPAPDPAEKDVKVGNTPEQSQPAESIESPATVKACGTGHESGDRSVNPAQVCDSNGHGCSCYHRSIHNQRNDCACRRDGAGTGATAYRAGPGQAAGRDERRRCD